MNASAYYSTKKAKEIKKFKSDLKKDQKKYGMLKVGTTRRGWFDKYK